MSQMVIKASEKQAKEIRNMFKFYDIDTANTYPFRPYPESLSCFFANFYKEIIKAFFLSLVHYHVLPYWFHYEHRIGLLAEGHLIHKVEANFVIEDLIGLYK